MTDTKKQGPGASTPGGGLTSNGLPAVRSRRDPVRYRPGQGPITETQKELREIKAQLNGLVENAQRMAAAVTAHVAGSTQGREASGRSAALKALDPLIEEALAAVVQRVPEVVHARQEKLSQDVIDLLVDAYLKGAPTAPARHEIEMDNARERARFVEEFPCYTSREIAEYAGHGAANASATATRWKRAGRIFGLPWKGSDLYPAFQFSEGRPRPVIARIIAALPERMSGWQTAFWLTSTNGWLGGATPLERIGDESALIEAADRESEALGG